MTASDEDEHVGETAAAAAQSGAAARVEADLAAAVRLIERLQRRLRVHAEITSVKWL